MYNRFIIIISRLIFLDSGIGESPDPFLEKFFVECDIFHCEWVF